jgi:O-antigen/teichoic acid export membrane protein
LGSGIVTLVLQLIAYPFLAKYLGSVEYGTILTEMGIANILVVTLGGGLNNTRLIQHETYIKQGITADYAIMAVSSSIFGGAAIALTMPFVFGLQGANLAFLVGYVVLGVLNGYYSVGLRLKLDFKGLLFVNTLLALGYLAGVGLLYITGFWAFVFFAGEVAASIYYFTKQEIVREPLARSKLFKESFSKWMLLIGSAVISNVVIYLDRLIIYPVMGANDVAIYTVATFFGKALGLVAAPIAGVLLSYFAQADFVMNLRRFNGLALLSIAACGAFTLVSVLVSPAVSGFFYPTIIASAKPYLFIANLAAIVFVSASFIRPAVLKYAPTVWQPVIQGIYGVTYFVCGYIALQRGGMMAFCYAILGANALNLIILYIAGVRAFTRNADAEAPRDSMI